MSEDRVEDDSVAGRAQVERRMEARRKQPPDGPEWAPLRRGWCLGPAAFKAQLLERMDGKLGGNLTPGT